MNELFVLFSSMSLDAALEIIILKLSISTQMQ